MADPSVTVTATDSSGVAYSITLLINGPAAAILAIKKPDVGPDDLGTAYALSNVQRRGSQVVCQTPILFATATIAMDVGSTSVEIDVTGVWFAPPPQTYTISAADGAALLAWLQNFPESTTMVFPSQDEKEC